MNKEEVYSRLTSVFKDVFDDQTIVIKDDTTSNDIEGWDSLMHISLISAVEDEFNIRFSMKATTSMKNVGEMVDYILENVK